ncbi:flavodoxin family protein [Acinetobacter baumannii]|uniref:flavodoxin family protein n=1 Tax=Acinetobacter baumannii TaxID=470 RepID=UPI001C0B3DF7|nr:flavodoxin family protein [Acinetobacter baumannii]MBU3082491.1 flavodoxin family protein [Acinetobacter baumannii]MDC4652076.1 flavodoxin family protein [Acinetobacter baumannii]MDC5116125.1 flavodoxin family protein [Acinetobacter baumannii]MDC5449584.1 flavodoxin family protein [Acinetobacter baumannii]
MRICVLVGSSRKNGVSQQVCELIRQLGENRFQCDFIYLSEYNIENCDQDNKCSYQPCQINDDTHLIVDRMLDSDAIIYMPVMHAYGTNSRFQSFLERVGYGFLRPLKRPLKDKVAGVVVVGRRYGHTNVYSQVVLNILLNKMILAGSGFPTTFYGMLGGATEDIEAIDSLQQMLNRMVEISNKINYYSLSRDPILV